MLLNKEKRKKKKIGEKCWTFYCSIASARSFILFAIWLCTLYEVRFGTQIFKWMNGFLKSLKGLVFTAMRNVFNVIYWEPNNRWCHWCCCCCYDRLLPFLQRLSKTIERSICKVTQTHTHANTHIHIHKPRMKE